MFGIAVIDVQAKSARYVRSALPHSPVAHAGRRRRVRVADRAVRR
jgi:hypothetical protein